MLISAKTNVNKATLAASTGVSYGGSPLHRFADLSTSHGATVNARPNLMTQGYFSSDSMEKYSENYDNYSVHYQGIFLMNYSLLQYLAYYYPTLINKNKYYHMHLHCDECTVPIYD